ncbi:hypothetical protein L202_00476 [Cryptococcus amylolentus CBS 6039]|uniref:CBF1-interacting co-repressor CIR N-terminal domain-containing protein n=1 Tax=Cryptococcus amylolentus CBS 6039 TaxID=1295533 RepID=A0A1E3I9M3_9TREE|nr:hypothetical protein L202_00476 [Cryptococcus amylolentus CBS 6039]ODN84546.1 hypothetical protein L202_00476 [Cryptococcus amylolentus CBS 6039]
MPRLQILQHKSYHPYLEKNKQRVREDEARAREEEQEREQHRVDAESQQRLTALRRRAGSPTVPQEDDLPSTSSRKSNEASSLLLERHKEKKAKEEKRERKKKKRLDFDFPSETARRSKGKERQEEEDEVQWEKDGHFNLFADVERDEANGRPAPTLAEIAKKKKDQEKDPFTVYLARPDKETKPWYTDRDMKRYDEKEVGEDAEFRRARDRRKDARSKNRNDPLTSINSLLSSHRHSQPSHHKPSTSTNKTKGMSERERALALLSKDKPTPSYSEWGDTPSTVSGGTWADDFERQKERAGRRYNGSR